MYNIHVYQTIIAHCHGNNARMRENMSNIFHSSWLPSFFKPAVTKQHEVNKGCEPAVTLLLVRKPLTEIAITDNAKCRSLGPPIDNSFVF
jgi:hypothetical protein